MSSCRSGSLSRNELSRALKTNLNPVILELKLVTIDYKLNSNKWPGNKYDFQDIYGDSVSSLLNKFMNLNFNNLGDSLIIIFQLNKDLSLTNPVIEFIDPNFYSDSSKFQIETNTVLDNNSQTFQTFDEGKLIFTNNLNSFLIIYYYKTGKSIDNIRITNK